MNTEGQSGFKKTVATEKAWAVELRASVLDCGSPLPLYTAGAAMKKRQRAAAVQNLAESPHRFSILATAFIKLLQRQPTRAKFPHWKFGTRSSMAGVSFIFILLLLVFPVRAADEFGDISVAPNAIYTGSTFHGYAEMRVVLENHSHSKTHVVTLVYPNNAYGNYGNNISRLSRTVTLGPDAREVVSLLQPPLPAQGDNSIRVEVDHRHGGEVRAPNANNHCNYNSRGGLAATVLVSRSLDYDAVERVFHANHGAFTAAMAVGPPDASGGGYQPSTWMPDTRHSGQTNWLELDYKPQPVDKISIYKPVSNPLAGEIILTGVSGTNVAHIPMSSGRFGGTGHSGGTVLEFSLPITGEPVKTIRLNFSTAPPHDITTIDAVEISGPSGSQWAADARASSDNSASAGAYTRGGANVDAVESLRAESPAADWSEHWLGYSPFDAIALNAADLNSMTPAALGAIGDYLSAGGIIFLPGQTNLPAAWHPWRKQNLPDGAELNVGFGRCFAFRSENLSTLDPKSVQTLREATRSMALFWQGLPSDSGAANAQLPIVENLKIPTRGIVIIMLAFIILIGPVNIIYLNRHQHRTWMLWTIPAIAFATTVLVFAYSLLREGITPDTRIAGLTLLDQASHHAATVGGTAFYCPLTPSRGLRFDFETEATPLVSIGSGSGAAREVDWTQGQQFQHGWVSARVPAHFHLRKSETSRARLQVVNENGRLQVINSLGAPVKSLWVADANLNVYEAHNVDAGQKAGLILSKQSPATGKSGADGLWRSLGFAAPPEALKDSAGTYLLPDTYLAVLDGNPFIENALGSAARPKRTKSSAVVFGILESSEAQ